MELKKLPDLTFAAADPDVIDSNIVTTVEAILGRNLARADPLRLFLRGIEALIIQQRVLIDTAAKMGLLAYATGDYLDHIGVLVGTDRLGPSAATVTLRFTLSAARATATIIPKGTRATAGDGVYFALDADTAIEPGGMTADAEATCTETGEKGNGYAIGELKTITNPVPFVASVTNTTKSEGGTDMESDDSYRERIHEAPERFSTAGPSGAYEYFTKRASSKIVDVSVENGGAGIVVVRPLVEGGELPGDEILATVRTALNDRSVRPLTDMVKVEAPQKIGYSVSVKYWISRDDTTEAVAIQDNVEKAVQEFVQWQREKLGRDINPTELYYKIRAAGAKRAEISAPAFTAVSKGSVAIADDVSVTLEGLEDA